MSNIKTYDEFITERGWAFSTDSMARAAYIRFQKYCNNELITSDEFLAESEARDLETAKSVYHTLVILVDGKKLAASKVYEYARFHWCIQDPTAIVSYQANRDKWLTNNCDATISCDTAKVAINREWGFEVSRIEIIGTPYYESTDWQFVRFNCLGVSWLWQNEELIQVYQ